MKNEAIATKIVLVCLTILFFNFSKAQDSEPQWDPLTPQNSSERREKSRCEWNFYRGEACEQLLNTMCLRINNNNVECLRYRVEKCHDNYRGSKEFEEEAGCEKGSHVQHCYGDFKHCGSEQTRYCEATNYQARYCTHQRWQYCRNEIGVNNSTGEFKSVECRVFNNQELIRWNNDQIDKKLLWLPRGENQIRSKTEDLDQKIKDINNQIRKAEDQLNSWQGQLAEIIGSVSSSLKKQIEALKENIEKMKKQRDLWVNERKEYRYMGNICEAYTPYRGE